MLAPALAPHGLTAGFVNKAVAAWRRCDVGWSHAGTERWRYPSWSGHDAATRFIGWRLVRVGAPAGRLRRSPRSRRWYLFLPKFVIEQRSVNLT
jgi:hypothetical protein